jgi:hypothetical protein
MKERKKEKTLLMHYNSDNYTRCVGKKEIANIGEENDKKKTY